MCLWCTATNFACQYSFASLISRLSSVFIFSEERHVTCRKRLEFNEKMFEYIEAAMYFDNCLIITTKYTPNQALKHTVILIRRRATMNHECILISLSSFILPRPIQGILNLLNSNVFIANNMFMHNVKYNVVANSTGSTFSMLQLLVVLNLRRSSNFILTSLPSS